jgi:transposase-like protein
MFGVSIRTLGRWLKLVQQQGFTGLFDRVPSSAIFTMSKKRKNKGEPLSELEQLKEENLRLRAELDLIKKVEALVSERCKRITESVQKPSKS